MPATALLRYTQGATVGAAGQAIKGTTGVLVTAQNSDNTGVRSWEIELLYHDPSGTVPLGLLAFSDDGTTPVATFTPDVSGSWRLRLRVWDAPGRPGRPLATDTDIRVFGINEPHGLFLPPPQRWPKPLPTPESGEPGAKPSEVNFSGQPDGWAGNASNDGLANHALRELDKLKILLGTDGQVRTIVSGVEAYADPPTGGGGDFTLPPDGILGQPLESDGADGAQWGDYAVLSVRAVFGDTAPITGVATNASGVWTANADGSFSTSMLSGGNANIGERVIWSTGEGDVLVTVITDLGEDSVSPWVVTEDTSFLPVSEANDGRGIVSLHDGSFWSYSTPTAYLGGNPSFLRVTQPSSGTAAKVLVGTGSGNGNYVALPSTSPTSVLGSDENGGWTEKEISIERIPTQMVFTEVFKQAWFDGITNPSPRLLPPNLVWVDDNFSNSTTTRFTSVTESNLGAISISGSQFVFTNNSGSTKFTLVYEGTAIGMPQVMTTVDVVGRTGSNGAYAGFLLGLVKDGSNYLIANWDPVNNIIQLQLKIAGTSNFYNSVSTSGWSFPTTIGMSVIGNSFTLYVYQAGAWSLVSVLDITPYLDFKAQDHSLWYAAFGFVSPSTVTNVATFDNFKVGRFGGVGLRDVCVVTNEDGSPNYTGSQVTALATIAGPNNDGSMGVFTIDLEKKTFTQTGLIMVNRSSKVQNDLAGHIILEGNGDQHLTVSSWGTGGTAVRILYKLVSSGTNLLVGSHVVSSMATLALTELPSGGSQWDPFLIKQGGTWYIAYTASPTTPNLFYPALDSSTNLTSWTSVGKDPTAARFEGTRLLKFNNANYLLTGGQFTMRMYDLSMAYIGLVNVIPPGAGGTQPHAMIFPYNGLEILITFDETTWPVSGGNAFSWGSIRWFASPRY